jgi:hypothetical protein
MSFEYNARFSSPISITENGVMTPNGILEYDKPKTIEEHYNDFCKIGGVRFVNIDKGNLALKCGTQSGIIVIQVGANRGDFVPKLDPGSYGVAHTALGNLFRHTKRIINVNNGTTSVVFGIIPSDWPDGLNSCTLVQYDLEGRGAIILLADCSTQPIEPTPGYRFYTPFFHEPGAGSAFAGCRGSYDGGGVYPLYPLGIMTLNRFQLSELLRAFNKDWSNGPVFARRSNNIETSPPPQQKKTRSRKKKKKEGLDKWC